MIELQQLCKRRLVVKLEEILPVLKVDHDNLLNFTSAIPLFELDNILPDSGKVHDELEKYVGEYPIATFIRSYINSDLRFNKYASDRTGIALTEYDKYDDIKIAAKNIIRHFCDLPYSYKTIIELPDNISSIFDRIGGEIHFSDTMYAFKPTDEHDDSFPLTTGNESRDLEIFVHRGLLSLFGEKKWDKSKYYLCISSTGFIGILFETATQRAIINNLKSLIGLLIALRFFKFNRKFLHSYASFENIYYKADNNRCSIEKSEFISKEVSEVLESIVIENFDGRLDEDHILEFNEIEFSQVRKVYNNDSKNIQLAAQWLLDSYAIDNNILSFIQAAISIEILLGDEKYNQKISLSELLKNRCAYLIGVSAEDREKIIKTFEDIYSFRSKIVHRGINQLKGDGFVLLQKLQWYCSRVIQEEIKLIKDNTQAN